MSRNSHHSTGIQMSPVSTSGSAKPSGSAPIMPAPSAGVGRAAGHIREAIRRRCGGAGGAEARLRSGGCGEWRNTTLAGWGRGAGPLDLGGVVGPPVLGPARGDAPAVFGLYKFDATPIGEGFLGGIDDLHDMAMRAATGKLGDDLPHVGNLAPQIRQ